MTVRLATLANGMRVVTHTMPHLETVSLGVWVDAGSRYETPELNGVAHMLEHMAFKGTTRRTARMIVEEIESVGGHLNAYTSREQTAYCAKVLKEDVELALDILADILQHSLFDEEELARERTVVLQEIAQVNDTPDDLIFDRFQETAFPDQPLGRSILGRAPLVAAMARETLAAYMGSHYDAPRMVLAAAGRLEHERIVDVAARLFDSVPRDHERALEPARYVGGDRRERRELEQVHFLLGFNGVPYHDEAYFAHQVLSALLGGGMSSRLFQEVREKRGLAYSVYSFTASYLDAGIFGVYAGTGAGELADLVPVVCDEIREVATAVREDELLRARAQMKAGLLMALESPSARCEQLARQLMIFGRVLPTEELIEKIEAVDRGALCRAARRLCEDGAPTVAAIGPIDRLESFERIRERLV